MHVATTGRPQLIASRRAFDMPSARDGRTNMSASSRYCRTSGFVPTNSTCAARPSDSTRSVNSERDGPSPRSCSFTVASAVRRRSWHARISVSSPFCGSKRPTKRIRAGSLITNSRRGTNEPTSTPFEMATIRSRSTPAAASSSTTAELRATNRSQRSAPGNMCREKASR